MQEHLNILPPRKLRQPRVQFGGHDNRSRQVWVYLQSPKPVLGSGPCPKLLLPKTLNPRPGKPKPSPWTH